MVAEQSHDAQVLRIMLIGDSITQADSKHRSYRYELWKRLVDTGVVFDLVGSMTGNFKGDPVWPAYKSLAFDRNHEGHWGWRVDQILARIDSWLKSVSPDVALIHLGTNDIFQRQSVASTLSELKELIARFRADNAEIKILLAEVIPSRFHNEQLDDLNRGIKRLANDLTSRESPIYLVDLGESFDPNVATYDGVHPNELGEAHMADVWFEGIMLLDIFQ